MFKPYDGQEVREDLPQANGFAEEIKHFVQCLQTGTQPIQTHIHGINVLKVILGAYESVAKEITVTL